MAKKKNTDEQQQDGVEDSASNSAMGDTASTLSTATRGPVLNWTRDKLKALAFVVRNPDSEDGDTLDEITNRLSTISLADIDPTNPELSDAPLFSADVASGALAPHKVQLKRNELIRLGLSAPPLRRRSGGGPRGRRKAMPDIDELNSL